MTSHKHRTATYNYDIFYRSGGNPPISPGLFNEHGDRIAWWPAGYEPTMENMHKVVTLAQARDNDEPVSRNQIRQILGKVV